MWKQLLIHQLRTVTLSEEIPSVQRSTLTPQVFKVQQEHSRPALYLYA